MCLIAFALNLRDDCPLLLASNRDEFWSRPTLPLSVWTLSGGGTVCSGRDVQAGGTWLGFNQEGRVAMLTNVREGSPEVAPRSRGELVTAWLAGHRFTPHWSEIVLRHRPADYGGFNLVLGDAVHGDWLWLSNRPAAADAPGEHLPMDGGWHGRQLKAGLYGLSNAGLDTPWPKTQRLKAATARALQQLAPGEQESSNDWRSTLHTALLDRRPAAAEQLPQTGIPLDREQQLSSAFVHMPNAGYGTRSSLIARWHGPAQGGRLDVEEWTHATTVPGLADAPHWPLHTSRYQRISMSTWGMPTSS